VFNPGRPFKLDLMFAGEDKSIPKSGAPKDPENIGLSLTLQLQNFLNIGSKGQCYKTFLLPEFTNVRNS